MALVANNLVIQSLLNLMLRKITVPSDFKGRTEAVRLMQEDDLSGLVDSLTDFAVNTACVDFGIETDNEEFTKTLKKWLDTINIGYKGQIPMGVKELAKEYFKERWKYSSFPILKIAEWKAINGILVPTKMFFVDGESIHAKDKDKDSENLKLINYDYYIGQGTDYPLTKNVIFAKTNGRWFDKYPIPYLIKRGVYHNWKIIESLKNMEGKILEQVIPFLLQIKKGFQGTTPDTSKTYSSPELQSVIDDFKLLMEEVKAGNLNATTKAPVRVTNFDEEIKNIIPELKSIFEPILFAQAERNILAGLGFIDVIQGISDTRRESILNPKVFVQEVLSGGSDFKQILNQLVYLIKEKNKRHTKYIGKSEFYITSSPISIFQTDKFKNEMRMLWERGQVSNRTYCEIVGETDYRTEVHRREKEAKEGLDYTMYPHIKENREGQGIDIPGEEPVVKDTDKKGKPIPTDKLDDKDKYNLGKVHLETAPYKKVTELPDNVKKKLSPAKQKAWMDIFNNAYKFYFKKFKDTKKAETLAFRTAWSQIKQVRAEKNKK